MVSGLTFDNEMSSQLWTSCTSAAAKELESSSEESVGESNADGRGTKSNNETNESLVDLSFEIFERIEEHYFGHLSLLHKEHMHSYNRGFIGGKEFWPETVDDVYNKNTYTISSFYQGDSTFDVWKEEYDSYLYLLVCRAQEEEEHGQLDLSSTEIEEDGLQGKVI